MTQLMGDSSLAPEELVLWEALQGHTFPVLQASFAPDMAFVVSTDGKDLRLWTWNKRHHLVFDRMIATRTHQIAISCDSQSLASIESKYPFPNHIHLWSASGELLKTYVHQGDACHLAFSPVADALLIADTSGHLQWWEMSSATLVAEAEPPPESLRGVWNSTVRHLAFAPDGKQAAVQWYTKQGAIQVWELETAEEDEEAHLIWKGSMAPSPLAAHSRVAGLTYTPDGRYLAVASEIEGRIWLFDALSLQAVGAFAVTYQETNGIAACAFSPDGAALLVAGCNGTLWRGETARIGEIETLPLRMLGVAHASTIGTLSTVIGSVEWSSDGQWLLTTGTGLLKTHQESSISSEAPDDLVKRWEGVPDFTVKVWKVEEGR